MLVQQTPWVGLIHYSERKHHWFELLRGLCFWSSMTFFLPSSGNEDSARHPSSQHSLTLITQECPTPGNPRARARACAQVCLAALAKSSDGLQRERKPSGLTPYTAPCSFFSKFFWKGKDFHWIGDSGILVRKQTLLSSDFHSPGKMGLHRE